jgi:4-hydroxy-tetrahydrodipicolinate reductase
VPEPLRIAIAGAGRMGQRIAARLADREDLALAGIWSRGQDLAALADGADVLVDFSLPEGTRIVLDVAARLGKPLVCGVSGLSAPQLQALELAAASIPIVYDRNMSQGITVLEAVLRELGGALGPEFAVSIEETHHVHKKDAPSGTALKLGEALAAVRPATELVYKSQRVGDVPGDHVVVFRSPSETLSLEHSVTTRDVFADGALRAARWVVGRAAGRYTMQNVLFGA